MKTIIQPQKIDYGIIGIIFLLILISRVLFQSDILYHWDSVNFALAVEEYDISKHQPHPPGTFILYVLSGRLINLFLDDPAQSLVWVSSGLGIAAYYWLGRIWFDRTVGLIAVGLAATSPMVWFHGEVALSYMPEFVSATLILISLYYFRTQKLWVLAVSAVALGLSGGIRPNTPVFLGPLWLVMAIRYYGFKWRHALIVIGSGALGASLWLIPLIVITGVGQFIYLWEEWQAQHLDTTQEGANMFVYMARFVVFVGYTVGVAGILGVGWLPKLKQIWREAQVWFLAGSILPAATYFMFFHLKQQGHIFTLIPSLLLLSALLIKLVGPKLHATRGVMALAVSVALLNVLLFLVAPAQLFGDPRLIFNTPSYHSILHRDQFVRERITYIEEQFSPDETTVLAGTYYFRHPLYYFKDYQHSNLVDDLDHGTVVLSPEVCILVLFDDQVVQSVTADSQSKQLSDGTELRYIVAEEGQQFRVSREVIELVSATDSISDRTCGYETAASARR